MKAHLFKAFATIRDERRYDLHDRGTLKKFKAVTQATEVELGKMLGKDGLARFRAWKTAPGNIYFGETGEGKAKYGKSE